MRWQRSPMIFEPIFGPAYTSKTSNWPKKQQSSPDNDNQSRPPAAHECMSFVVLCCHRFGNLRFFGGCADPCSAKASRKGIFHLMDRRSSLGGTRIDRWLVS